MTFSSVSWLVLALVTLLPPIVFIFIRENVKRHRQEIVKDLSAVFSLPRNQTTQSSDELIPSFEFVKYKYFLDRAGAESEREARDYSFWSWLTALTPLVAIILLITFIAAHVLTCLCGSGCQAKAGTICITPEVCSLVTGSVYGPWVASLLAAFAGGYAFMLLSFFRAINNFDFSPSSLVGAATSLMISAALASIFAISASLLASGAQFVQAGVWPTAAIVGFAVGYFPESAIRTVLRSSELKYFKRENPGVFESLTVTPVEIIDGIDTEIRDRLAVHHIRSTQNLAAANPLMLFVETPYGVYQIMDWVAQAQLCCSVGPDQLLKLWKLGIRTLFDLERAATDATCSNGDILLAIGHILFQGNVVKTAQPLAGDNLAGKAADDQETRLQKAVIANIEGRLDDPHVHRLRQIYIRVGERLGPDNRRFKR